MTEKSPPALAEYDLFVSYSPVDREWVEGYLLDALDAANLRVLSELNFTLGVPRLNEFERAIRSSNRTLLVLSPAYMAEGALQFMDVMVQNYGLESGTWPVIPLLLQPVTLPPRLAFLVPLDATDPQHWADVIARLCDTLQAGPPAPAAKPPCPYPGMRAFREQEAASFYGREAEIDDLVQRLRRHPFLAVIGPSGSGKSSLVHAGLAPALRRSALFGTGGWLVRSIRPGAQPMTELATALDVVDVQQFSPAALLATEPDAARLLLVVDQFEEVFTQGGGQQEEFFVAIQQLIALRDCFVVITVRSDFFDDLLRSTLWPVIQPRRLEITPLGVNGLRSAIVKPAEAVGVFIESALVERLVAGSAGQPGLLPFVQEVMVRLWEKLERRFLPLRAYEALVLPLAGYSGTERSGIQAAMAQLADEIINHLSHEQSLIAQRVLLRLVQFGQGRPDTRRQQPVSALRAANDDPAVFDQTLRYLTDNRLLTMSGAESGEPKVDISHEAMLTSWPMLEGWIANGKEDEQRRRQLEDAASAWEKRERSGGLLDEGEFAELAPWLERSTLVEAALSPSALQFVEQSRQQVVRGRRLRRIRRILAMVLIAAVLSVVSLVAVSTLRTRSLQSHWQMTGAPQGSLAALASSGGRTAIGSYGYGVAYGDNGKGWTDWLADGLPRSSPSTTTNDPASTVRTIGWLALDAAAPYTRTAWVVDGGIYQFSAQSNSWQPIGEGVPINSLGTIPLAAHRGNLLAIADDWTVYAHAPGEVGWQNLAEVEPALKQETHAVAFGADGTAFVSGAAGLFRGTGDYPWRWQRVAGIPEATLFALDDQGNIYVITKPFQPQQRPELACFDANGRPIRRPSPVPVTNPLMSVLQRAAISSIAAHPTVPQRVYVADNFGAILEGTCDGVWRKIGQQQEFAEAVPSALAVLQDSPAGDMLLWADQRGLRQRAIE